VTAINIIAASGYSCGSGLPTISIDTTYQISAATPGTPTLMVGISPDGAYPLPSLVAPGVTDLDNIYRMLLSDTVHPSPVGLDYLSTPVALSIFEGVMAL
jgi:hypothetical protein